MNPATSFYNASKFAVTALTEGLRKELRDIKSNIKITVRSSSTYTYVVIGSAPPHMQGISPGVVATEFGPRRRGMDNPKEAMTDLYATFGYPVSLVYVIIK